MDPGIVCFQHCGPKIFCFELPDLCPICKNDLSQTNFSLLPFRVPYPFVRASQYPCAVLIKPTTGDFLNDYYNSMDLHIGVTTSSGIIVEFDRNGLRRHRNGQWGQCLLLDQATSPWREHWDNVLLQICRQKCWLSKNYNEEKYNCYTHTQWRKLAKKSRRKRIRGRQAEERKEEEEQERIRRENSPSYQTWLEEQERTEAFAKQEEARLAIEQEEEWVKIEKEDQKRWAELQAKIQQSRLERSRQAILIKEEWEREQMKLKVLKEKREKEIEERKKQHEELQRQIREFVESDGDIPEGMKVSFETNPLKAICPFFQKTGACRFRDTCSRNHIRPGISRVLLIPNFYSHYSLSQLENEYGNDFTLEYENAETYDHFKEFFYDVITEMEKYGKIRQFKVCCNHEPHLRGNVYLEYSTYREAVKSYQKFYGRFYGGKQLHIEFCNIQSWKSAICGLFARKKCPKGSSCNFLHVFSNPYNLFGKADLDLHRTPPETDNQSSEQNSRNWRWSESPERIPILSNCYKKRDTNHKRKRSCSRNRKRNRSSSGSSERKRSHSQSSERKRHQRQSRKKTSNYDQSEDIGLEKHSFNNDKCLSSNKNNIKQESRSHSKIRVSESNS